MHPTNTGVLSSGLTKYWIQEASLNFAIWSLRRIWHPVIFWLNWKFDKNWRYFFFYRIIWWSEFWCVFFLIWRPIHLLIRYHLAFLTKMLKEEVVTTGIPLQVIKYPNFNWTLIVVKIVLTLASSFFDSMIFRNSSKFVVENSPKPSLLSLKCQKWMAKEFGQRNFSYADRPVSLWQHILYPQTRKIGLNDNKR